MAGVTMTWRELLDYRPTSAPRFSDPSASVDTTSFTYTDSPTDFRSYLQAKGILDDNVPNIVLCRIEDFQVDLAESGIRSGRDVEGVFYAWFTCARWITRELFTLVGGQGDVRVEKVDPFPNLSNRAADIYTTLDEVIVAATSVESKRPNVLSNHLNDITTDHTYQPQQHADGKVMISKVCYPYQLFALAHSFEQAILANQGQRSSPSGILFRRIRGIIHEDIAGELELDHWAAVISPIYRTLPNLPTLPASLSTYLTTLDAIPFLPVLIYLLLPNTTRTEPERPEICNRVTDNEKTSPPFNESSTCDETTSATSAWVQKACNQGPTASMVLSQVVFTRRLHHGKRADVYQGFLDCHPVIYKRYSTGQHHQFCRELAAYMLLSMKSILILADAGHFLKGSLWNDPGVQSLTHKQRVIVMNIIRSLHAIGVRHGDFQPRNLVEDGDGMIRVIDFEHSELDHICHGKVCSEVAITRKNLGLRVDDSEA
ncbi:hypothetical protein BDP27DRAFT_1435841 [Rhodocollybia butyracea]|uniref:Rhodanese domain-containing protein n=1 Tax=Rhodocollybia butyracea TaxID=206335 RepID=A0A9P5P648_9AGAR|nr:hypothetical protein BDP27DRAFT_1435841 [Rhodocollybia butyracea]